jgi:hypothetical protein
MQESTTCFSKLDKPGKDEQPGYLRQTYRSIRVWIDSDKKRTTVCKDPARNQLKIH